MGAKEQENATESGGSVARLMDWCEERDSKPLGANGSHPSAQREGIPSPLTTQEGGSFCPVGARMGAIPFPQLAVTKSGDLVQVRGARQSWGLTEAETACGYARCATGCKAPPVLQLAGGEWLCAECADAMQVAGGVA